MGSSEATTAPDPVAGVNRVALAERLARRSLLPSLCVIHTLLRELLSAEQRYTAQISEVIRRDPSLTTRLLRLANSVFYGLCTPVTNIEEAIFYLGIRQVRELALSTPIIEDLNTLTRAHPFPWRAFWQHCIATALLTREIMAAARPVQDEVEYVAGLLHDVGRIVMASECPREFAAVCAQCMTTQRDLRDIEIEALGMDHCELGAIYLERHRLPEVIVEAVRWHAEPERAAGCAELAAAVQLANHLMRLNRVGDSGNPKPVTDVDWLELSGWNILFPDWEPAQRLDLRSTLKQSLDQMPRMLESLL